MAFFAKLAGRVVGSGEPLKARQGALDPSRRPRGFGGPAVRERQGCAMGPKRLTYRPLGLVLCRQF